MLVYDFIYGIVAWLMPIVRDIAQGVVYWLADVVPIVSEIIRDVGDMLGILTSPEILHTLTVAGVSMIVFTVIMINLLNFIWVERKILGRLMDRRGPMYVSFIGMLRKGRGAGWLQNVADGMKLFLKEVITPRLADGMLFHTSIVVLASSSLLIVATVPITPELFISNPDSSVLLTMALFAIAPIAILVGGWASNNKYTIIGGMRSAAQMMSYEIPLLLSITGVLLLAGSFNFFEIVAWQTGLGWPRYLLFFAVSLIGLVVFFVSMMAELERIPFDLPEAEAELVEGWTTEYSGMRFGFFFMVEWLRTMLAAMIITHLFLAGWAGPAPIPGVIWFFAKVYVVFAIMVWIRGALPRIRTDQILELGWKRLLPLALINLFIAVTIKTWGLL